MRRLIVVVAVVAALAALFLFGLFRGQPDRDVPSNLLGKPAPDFALPLYERYQPDYGDTLALSQKLGTPMVVNFWASWCTPCLDEAPVLEQGYRRWGPEGVLFVGIQTQDRDQFDAGRQFLTRFDLSYPNGMDNTSRIGVEYALFGVPETFFIDRSGTVVAKHVGPVTPDVLDREIGRMLE